MIRRVLAILLAMALAVTGIKLWQDRPRYHGPVSDHFDGVKFHNPVPFEKALWQVFLFWWQTPESDWQPEPDAAPGPRPDVVVGKGALRATFVNHATVLIQADGVNVLTDPIWSERASPSPFFGPRRYRPPGLRFEDLPRIDAVVISHNHYDHLDLPTLKRLKTAHDPMFYVGLGEAATLRGAGIERVTELDWWQSATLPNGRKLWSVPSQHWTARGIGGRNRTLWQSFVVETAGGPVYFAGDTGYGPHFKAAGERFGPMRLALLPIGAYEPRWFMTYQHANPAEAVQAHRDLRAAASLGIHFGTFKLTYENQREPQAALARARTAAGLTAASFVAPEFGRGYDFAPLPPPQEPAP